MGLGTFRNREMQAAFDRGEAAPYLRGEGEFFLRSHTWADHDYAFVLRQMFLWAIDRGRLEEAASLVLDDLARTASADAESLVRRCWSLTLVAEPDDPVARSIPWTHISGLIESTCTPTALAAMSEAARTVLFQFLWPALRQRGSSR